MTAAEPATRPRSVFADELAFAESLAARAGELLMERYERVERVDYKSARDVVTEVDHLSEALIIAAIRERHPTDGILAEESGAHASGGGDAPTSGSGRVWIIDPVDGTINYANGIPFFCVSIALVEAGRPIVAVIHDPIRRETYTATDDGPALRDGRTIEASDKAVLSDIRVGEARSETFEGRSSFAGNLKLHGVTKAIGGSAELKREASGMRVTASFPLSLTDFGIEPPQYMGVGVGNRLIVKVTFLAAVAR